MTPHLLGDFVQTIAALSSAGIENPLTVPNLIMERFDTGGRHIEMVYAPFDHVNRDAKLVIVGMTPGRFQAANALRTAQYCLKRGSPVHETAAAAKVFASFSGEPMRGNLVRMLDLIGVAKLLDIGSTKALWDGRADLVHFTSALRYPVFVNGQNWSGHPDMVRTQRLRAWLEAYTGTELALLRKAVIVPLGSKVTAAMRHLAGKGVIDDERILDGLPHPSGANAERIAYFLRDKPAHLCSAKTNTTMLDTARAELSARVSRL